MMPPKITEYIIGVDAVNIWHPKKGDTGYSIAFGGGGWMPGTYDSIESAKLGAKACFIDESKFVTELQQRVNHFDKENRELTCDDVNNWLNQITRK